MANTPQPSAADYIQQAEDTLRDLGKLPSTRQYGIPTNLLQLAAVRAQLATATAIQELGQAVREFMNARRPGPGPNG